MGLFDRLFGGEKEEPKTEDIVKLENLDFVRKG